MSDKLWNKLVDKYTKKYVEKLNSIPKDKEEYKDLKYEKATEVATVFFRLRDEICGQIEMKYRNQVAVHAVSQCHFGDEELQTCCVRFDLSAIKRADIEEYVDEYYMQPRYLQFAMALLHKKSKDVDPSPAAVGTSTGLEKDG